MKDKLKELNDSKTESKKDKGEFNNIKPKMKFLLGFLWNSEGRGDTGEVEACNKKSEKRIKELEKRLEMSSTAAKDAGKLFRNYQKERIKTNKSRSTSKQRNNNSQEKNNNEHTME